MIELVRRRKRRRSYTRRLRRRWRKKDKRVPLLTTIPVAVKALVEPIMGAHGVTGVKQNLESGNLEGALYNGAYILARNFTGYDLNTGKLDHLKDALSTYGMIFIGAMGSKVATSLGANRAMKRIPFIGKYVKL